MRVAKPSFRFRKETKFLLIAVIVLGLMGGLQECTYDKETLLPAPNCPNTENISFIGKVQPLLRANCFSCHGNGSSDGNVSLDNYDEVKSLAISGHLLGAISHSAGFAPMPLGADKLSDCDIKAVSTWIQEGIRNN
jgi:hypothetical protein